MVVELLVLSVFLVNARGLQLECAQVLHETLLVTILLYGSESMILRGEG